MTVYRREFGGKRARPATQETTQLTGAAGLVAAVAAVLVAVALAPRLDAAPVEPALKLVAATTCRRNRHRISQFNFGSRPFFGIDLMPLALILESWNPWI